MNDNVNIRVGITGTGSCPGERRQTNGELAEAVANYDPARAGMPLDGWIREHYGIQARARTDRLSSELAADACLEAVRGAGLDVADIDFLILNTVAGDYRQPSTAAEVQGSIGMRADSFAMEINMPCAGSIYGIAVARGLMSAGHGKRALVAGVDKMSDIINSRDFIMAGMFGDGAGACVLEAGAGLAIADVFLRSRRDSDRALAQLSSGSAEPVSAESIGHGRHFLRQKGAATSAFILEALSEVVTTLMWRNGLNPGDVARIIPHQASRVLVEQAIASSGIDPSRAEFSLDRYGNTSSASVLITLHQFLQRNPRPGGPVVLAGMGAGLNWGGVLLRQHT